MFLTSFINRVHSFFTPTTEVDSFTTSLMQSRGQVIESISGLQKGVILLQGVYWKARLGNRSSFIPEGTTVSIVGRSENTLLVVPFVQSAL